MRKTHVVLALLITSIAVLISCSKGGTDSPAPPTPPPPPPPSDCSTIAKTWSANVSPLVQTYCNQSGCHDVASVNGPGPLTNYAQVFSARVKIRAQIAAGLMPQNATLNATQKSTILCWIDAGAPNN